MLVWGILKGHPVHVVGMVKKKDILFITIKEVINYVFGIKRLSGRGGEELF